MTPGEETEWLPLQHFDANDPFSTSRDFKSRNVLMGSEFTFSGGIYVPKAGTRGPLQWTRWPAKSGGSRKWSQWSGGGFSAQVTTASPLKVTPVLNTSGSPYNLSTDLDEITVVGPTGYTPTVGDLGIVKQACDLGSTQLVFHPTMPPSGGGGGSGTAGIYGNAIDGDLTFSAHVENGGAGSVNYPLCYGNSVTAFTSGGINDTFGFTLSHYLFFLSRPIFCHDLTIDANVHIFTVYPIFVTGTLTLNGEIAVSGNAYAAYKAWIAGAYVNVTSAFNSPLGAGGLTTANNQDKDGFGGGSTQNAVVDEGRDIGGGSGINAALRPGQGGNAGAGIGGPYGAANGTRGVKGGDNGAAAGSFWSGNAQFTMMGIIDNVYRPWLLGSHLATGGGGGGGGAAHSGAAGVGTAGGNGGPGGGIALVCAKTIAGSGKICADGGDGRAGFATGAGSSAGGGGGGNPGGIGLFTDSDITSLPITLSAVPGAGGAGAGGGANGTAAGAVGLIFKGNPSH